MLKPCLVCGRPTEGPRCSRHEIERDRNLAREQLGPTYIRYAGICQIGGEFVPRDQATLDHIVPISLGGTDHPTNLRLACLSHNSARNSF